MPELEVQVSVLNQSMCSAMARSTLLIDFQPPCGPGPGLADTPGLEVPVDRLGRRVVVRIALVPDRGRAPPAGAHQPLDRVLGQGRACPTLRAP